MPIAATVAADDPAARLEREFAKLSIPDRLRLGLGTVHCRLAPDVEERRRAIGLHLAEALEVLEHGPAVARDGSDPALGPLVRVTGVTARGRAVGDPGAGGAAADDRGGGGGRSGSAAAERGGVRGGAGLRDLSPAFQAEGR